jgi:hypothetical protein
MIMEGMYYIYFLDALPYQSLKEFNLHELSGAHLVPVAHQEVPSLNHHCSSRT